MQESLNFNYLDSLHKNWQSHHFIRTATSKYFTDLSNNLYISTALAAGKVDFMVDRAGHETDEMIFTIDEYEDLRKISQLSGLSLKKVLFYAQAQIPIIFENFKIE